MSRYHHLAHLETIEPGIHEKSQVKRGDQIGLVGNTGTTSPHVHYEVMNGRPEHWTIYTQGMTRDEVKNRYTDPKEYMEQEENIPCPFDWDKEGYSFLQKINGQNNYHPGRDLNKGDGWDDWKNPVKSPVNGTIVHIGEYGGWGNHVWIKEHAMVDKYEGHIISREGGQFALVKEGVRHEITDERAGKAALDVFAANRNVLTIPASEYDKIPQGNNF